jgi:hypothetical protein
MNQMDNVVDAGLEGLAAQEIAGAYKALCGMMLVQTAIAFKRKPCRRKDTARERVAAREWVANEGGVLTFGECCEVMGMDKEWTRQALHGLAEAEQLPPINRVVFGVKRDAYLADADCRGAGSHGPECPTGRIP